MLSLVAESRNYSPVLGLGLLTAVASLVVEHGLFGKRASVVAACRLRSCDWIIKHRINSCGAWAQLPSGMWDLPGPGIKPVAPALAGRFLTTGPPGKSLPSESCLKHLSPEEFFTKEVSGGYQTCLPRGSRRGSLRALLPTGRGLRLIVGPGLLRCELVSQVPRGPVYGGDTAQGSHLNPGARPPPGLRHSLYRQAMCLTTLTASCSQMV